jgi:hypothetical protein
MTESSCQIGSCVTLPPPPPVGRRSLRRHVEVSALEVLVEMLDSALKELKVAEEKLAEKEDLQSSLYRGSSTSWLRNDDEQSPEYHEVRLEVHDLMQKVACCEMKVNLTMEMALNPPSPYNWEGPILVTAAYRGNVEVVTKLLERRQNVNAISYGMTALSHAVQEAMPGSSSKPENYLAIVKLLLAVGADVRIPDDKGKTVLSRAIECGQKEIEAVLRAHGAV